MKHSQKLLLPLRRPNHRLDCSVALLITTVLFFTTASAEKQSSGAERVATYVQRLQSTFYSQKTLEDAAQATGVSRRQFTELFRRITHQSWKEYLQRLRLVHARDLLVQTDKSVVAVAFESGFEDLSHFHRVFKQAFELSPLAYRKKHQKSPAAE